MPGQHQPLDKNIDLAHPSAVASWLNKGVLGMGDAAMDYGPDGYDMTRFANPRQAEVGMHFTAASLQYLRRAEAAWQSGDSFGVVSAWIKLDSVGVVHHIFTTADEAGDNDYWAFGVDAANHLNLTAVIGGVSRSVAGTTALVADQWYRVSGMSDGGTWALYVNNARETVTPAGAGNDGSWLSDVPDRDNVCIGALRTNTILEYFDGSIKDVRYYGLTVQVPSDVAYYYREAVPDTDLQLYLDGRADDLTRYETAWTRNADVIVGHEMSFDGTGDYLSRTVAAWRSGDSAGSLEAWIRPGDITKGMAIFASCDVGTDNYIFEWALTAAGVQFVYVYEGGAVVGSATGTTAMVQDIWQHVVLVSTGSAYLMYRNGVLDALAGGGDDSGAWLADVTLRDNVTVGGLVYNSGLILPWEGQIATVKEYSRVLSAGEIANIYAREEPRV